jgi:ribosomal protein L37AE/L43A
VTEDQESSGRTRHLPVFHCPYCGDEELTPYEEQPGAWLCNACLRAFTVRLIATGVQE